MTHHQGTMIIIPLFPLFNMLLLLRASQEFPVSKVIQGKRQKFQRKISHLQKWQPSILRKLQIMFTFHMFRSG